MKVEDIYNHCKDFEIVMFGHEGVCVSFNFHEVDDIPMLKSYKREILDLPVKEIYSANNTVCVRVKTDKMMYSMFEKYVKN